MTLKIEAGKYYRTRDGRKVGPAKPYADYWHVMVGAVWNGYRENGLWGCREATYGAGGVPLDLIAEWTDTPADDTPVLFRDMTPAEKGALLLANHEGKPIQCFVNGEWIRKSHGVWSKVHAYRVKPAEPVVETVTMYYPDGVIYFECDGGGRGGGTHRITFNLIDGKPDVASIKMDEL